MRRPVSWDEPIQSSAFVPREDHGSPILTQRPTACPCPAQARRFPRLPQAAQWLLAVLALILVLLQPVTGFALGQQPADPIRPQAGELRWLAPDRDAAPRSIKQVLKLKHQWQGGAVPATGINFEPERRWYRWRLPKLTERGKTAWLTLGDHKYQIARVWFVNQRGRILSAKSASLDIPLAERKPPHHRQLVPFTTPKRGQYTVYFQLESLAPTAFSPAIYGPEAFEASQAEIRDQLLLGLGAILAIGLLACILTFTTQDIIVGFVGLLAFAIAGWSAEQHGFGFAWLWPEDPRYNLYAETVLIALVAAFTTLVGVNAYDRNKGIAHRLLQVSQKAVWLLSLATAATVSMIPAAVSLLSAKMMIGPALALTLIAGAARRLSGERDGLTIMAGAVALATGVIAISFSRAGELPVWWPAGIGELQIGMIAGFASLSLLLIGAMQRQTSHGRLSSLANSTLVETQRAVQIRLEETVKARTFELEAVNDQLAKVSRVDGLTGTYNRRYFDEALKDEIERSGRSSEPIGIVMIDLDHFKRLNDEHGHAAGDACLIEAARLAMHCAEADDGLVARYGGEEFVAMLINANESKALEFAERVRTAIADYEVQYEDKILRMTASLGVYCDVAREKGDEERLLREADDALYAAKHGGRNQVRVGGVALAIEKAAAEENLDVEQALRMEIKPAQAEPTGQANQSGAQASRSRQVDAPPII